MSTNKNYYDDPVPTFRTAETEIGKKQYKLRLNSIKISTAGSRLLFLLGTKNMDRTAFTSFLKALLLQENFL